MRTLIAKKLNPVAMQVVFVLGVSTILASVTLFTMTWIDNQVSVAANHSQVAILSARFDHSVEVLLGLLHDEDDRRETDLSVLLPGSSAILMYDELRFQRATAAELETIAHHGQYRGMVQAVDREDGLFRAYLASGDIEHLEGLRKAASDINQSVELLSPTHAHAATADLASARSGVWWARAGLLASIAVGTLVLGGTTWRISKRLRATIDRSRDEARALQVTTASVERRNGQFKALYQVTMEISETLSLKYVVQTTVREARRLVVADSAIVRLVEGDWLNVAGIDGVEHAGVDNLAPVPLGAGVVGRAAKRGKTIRFDRGAEAAIAVGEAFPGVQSGLVVPLIVGARVVGTLALWSRQEALFTADDEQIIEMMASQVATAVAAASSHQRSQEQAHTDALTELPNRRQLAKDTDERFSPAISQRRSIAVAMIDIDHFKRFNDEFGHKTGDVTLQKVASVLRESLREDDLVYRYGGEEFTIVLEGATEQDAMQRLERVRIAVARTPLTGDALQPVGPVTISIGLATYDGGADFETLIKRADAALYQAKWEGRNLTRAWAPGLGELELAA